MKVPILEHVPQNHAHLLNVANLLMYYRSSILS